MDLTELKRLTSSDVKKTEEKDKSENFNGNQNKDKNELKYRNESKNENEIENGDGNENENENENVLFLRVLTASLCELLTSKYGHDILDGKIAYLSKHSYR